MQSDDFKGNPYGAVTNQTGHFAIGLGVVTLTGMSSLWAVATAVLLYWAVVEVAGQGLSLWRDSLMDTAHVAGGAYYGISTVPYATDWTPQIAFLIWAALLAFEGWDKR